MSVNPKLFFTFARVMAGIYLHIPFCKKRCIYCDFYSTTLIELKESYVRALCQELTLRKNYLQREPIQTIYIGGGTPSLLTKQELSQLFSCIYESYLVSKTAEITMEANPDDLTIKYLQDLNTLPINRLSMGVQTFDDKKLKLLNRRHTAEQAYQAVMNSQEVGFQNISIDLIYGLPGESLLDWEKDLKTAFSLPITHLSAYHLMYEEGTPLWKLWKQQSLQEVEENLSVEFFEYLTKQAKDSGFQHYEISNFCRPNYHSRHNSSYWTGVPYLGCGAAAHSFNGHSRQWNVASLTKYIKGMETHQPDFELEELDLETRYNEFIMTGLRTSQGISLRQLKENFGEKFYSYVQKMSHSHLNEGTLELQGDRLKLSHQGIFISDGIMSDLMYVSD